MTALTYGHSVKLNARTNRLDVAEEMRRVYIVRARCWCYGQKSVGEACAAARHPQVVG